MSTVMDHGATRATREIVLYLPRDTRSLVVAMWTESWATVRYMGPQAILELMNATSINLRRRHPHLRRRHPRHPFAPICVGHARLQTAQRRATPLSGYEPIAKPTWMACVPVGRCATRLPYHRLLRLQARHHPTPHPSAPLRRRIAASAGGPTMPATVETSTTAPVILGSNAPMDT